MPSRRRFLQVGLAGAALLAAGGWLTRPGGAAAAPLRFLDARQEELLHALVPVVLAGALPAEANTRSGAVIATVEGFDRALAGLEPNIRKEIVQLLDLLTLAPGRIAVAGVWTPWREATAQEIGAFLDDWRASRFDLKRQGYRALTQLIQAAWYDNPLAWPAIGYPGPPDIWGQTPARP